MKSLYFLTSHLSIAIIFLSFDRPITNRNAKPVACSNLSKTDGNEFKEETNGLNQAVYPKFAEQRCSLAKSTFGFEVSFEQEQIMNSLIQTTQDALQ